MLTFFDAQIFSIIFSMSTLFNHSSIFLYDFATFLKSFKIFLLLSTTQKLRTVKIISQKNEVHVFFLHLWFTWLWSFLWACWHGNKQTGGALLQSSLWQPMHWHLLEPTQGAEQCWPWGAGASWRGGVPPPPTGSTSFQQSLLTFPQRYFLSLMS